MKYSIYYKGIYQIGTDDIAKAVSECRNMVDRGLEKAEITVWNDDGHIIRGFQF